MLPAVLTGGKESLQALQEKYKEVAALYKHIVNYLANVSQLKLSEGQTKELTNLMAAVNDMDHIGDLMDVNMVELGLRRIQTGFKVSEQTQLVIETLHAIVSDALNSAIKALVEKDEEAKGNPAGPRRPS